MSTRPTTQHGPGHCRHDAIYAALGNEAGVASYKAIPPKGYEVIIDFLDGWLKAIQMGSEEG